MIKATKNHESTTSAKPTLYEKKKKKVNYSPPQKYYPLYDYEYHPSYVATASAGGRSLNCTACLLLIFYLPFYLK